MLGLVRLREGIAAYPQKPTAMAGGRVVASGAGGNSGASGGISQRRFTRVERKYRASIRKVSETGYVEGPNHEFHAFGRGGIVGADDNSPRSPRFTGARTP